ncbi:MAG: RNA methyltransferase, partial [Bacilli bacterium]|nr:RNA methyltransferase [Bacilli bacterium]
LKQLKEKGYWIVGAEKSQKSSSMWDIKYDMPIVLVIGSEGKGISRLVKEECDFLVEIPMLGKINSLNASVSAGIMIYEIRRQQK